MRPNSFLLSAILVTLLGSFTESVPPPNAISGGLDGPAGVAADGSKVSDPEGEIPALLIAPSGSNPGATLPDGP